MLKLAETICLGLRESLRRLCALSRIPEGHHEIGRLDVNRDEGPFYQSQRTDLYLAAAKKCLANGAAFLCYCPAERYAGGDHAEPGQDEEPKAGGPRRVTRCSCRDGKPSTPGVKPAVRFKVPL